MGLVAIGVATTTFRETTPFPGTAALLPTVGTAMFIWANQASTTHSGAILAWRPIVFVGQISYSLYLLHWPVIVFTTSWFRDLITWKWRLGMLAAAFAGAILSWALVETPTRRKRWLATRRSLFVGAGVSLVLLMGAGVVIHRQAGIPSRFDTQTLKYATQDREERFQVNTTLEQLQRGQLIDFGTPGQPVTQLVWGDSHAMALMTGFDTACRKRGLRGQAVLYSSTAPLLGFVSRERYSVSDSPRYAQAVVDFALTHEIRQVFLVAFWRSYVDDPGFEDGLRDTVAALTAAGIQIVLVRDVPTQSEPVPRALARTYLLGGDVHRVGVAISQHRQQNESVDRLLSQVAGEDCVVIDPTMLLTDETGLCRAELDGVALYFDAHHLSTTGSRRIAPLIENVLPSRLKEKSP